MSNPKPKELQRRTCVKNNHRQCSPIARGFDTKARGDATAAPSCVYRGKNYENGSETNARETKPAYHASFLEN